MFRLAAIASAATAVVAVKVDLKQKSFLDTDSDSKNLAKPLAFHQKLLVCNAYPSDEGMTIAKNNVQLKSHDKLPYNSCKYVDGKIYNKDRVSFSMEKNGIEGTFEVDELPASDSVLLLIAQKRDSGNTDLMSFQSFAFPGAQAGSNDAQVAFINAVPEADSKERVRMSDATKRFTKESVREEDVLFNRVYVIESGTYDVDIVGGKFYDEEQAKMKKAEEEAAKKAHELALKKTEKKEAAHHEKKEAAHHAAEKKADKKAVAAEKKVEKKAEKKTEEKKVAEKKSEEKKPAAPAKKVSLLEMASEHTKNFFTSKKISLNLERGQDYVILQTGTAENPNLIAFPGPQQPTGILGFFKRMFSWI